MEHLTARKMDVHTELDNAELQPGSTRRHEVTHWLTTVEVKQTEVQSIAKQCQETALIQSKWELICRIERITKDVQELIAQGRFPYGLVLPDLKSRALPFQLTPLAGEMLHQNSAMIMEWLKGPLPYLIGVQGMGGVGKTTLLKHIHNRLLSDPKVAGYAQWVTVSQDYSLFNLQHGIARAIGLIGVEFYDEKDEDRRASMLHNLLGKRGKTVLVLDDVWDRIMLDKVGIPLGENNCKIIVSTRSLDVCRSLGCESFVIQVKPLFIDEAWELFVERLQNYDALAPEVQKLVASVADECACLPLAIITIAVCMRGVYDIEEWQNALHELRNLDRGYHDMENDVLRILKFSYDRLNGELLRCCFLSCTLYPEDHELERKELIHFWIMEGLLDDVGSRPEQWIKGHSILNKLENSCLLESCTNFKHERCVKMHDLIRDMGIYITKNHPRFMPKSGLQLIQVPEEKYWTKDLLKVSLSYNKIKEIPCGTSPETPKLTVLMLNDNPLQGIPGSFIVHLKDLTILDLSRTNIESLPDSISDMENLRALLLEGCEGLTCVPSVAKLTKIRVLALPDNGKMKEPPKGLERLMCIEKLTNCRWNTSDLISFNRLMQSWQKHTPRCYQLGLYDARGFFNERDERYMRVSGVELEEEKSRPLLPLTVRSLDVSDMNIEGNRSLADIFPSLAGVTELRVLKLRNCGGLESLETSTAQQECSIFPLLETLEHLDLDRLNDLKSITTLRSHSFPYLKMLCIWNCPNIKVVLPLKMQQLQPHLPNIELITVDRCEKVEEIFESDSYISSSWLIESEFNHRNSNPVLALPNLMYLALWDLPNLGSIYRGLLLCTSLSKLDIQRCPKLDLVSLSKPLICNASSASLGCIPTELDNPKWWEPLHQDYPQDASRLLIMRERFSGLPHTTGESASREHLDNAQNDGSAK